MIAGFWFRVCACVVSLLILAPITRAQELPDIREVASQVSTRALDAKAPLPSLATSEAGFIARKDATVSISLDDPALEGIDPATATLARLRDGGRWVAEEGRLDLKRRRLITRLAAGDSYAFVGASRFDLVRDQQAELCRASPKETAQLIDRVCTQILCPADSMAALDAALESVGPLALSALPGAASAGSTCERCLNPGGFDGGLLECRAKRGTPWGHPVPGHAPPHGFPWWPGWPVWQKSERANFCSPGTHKVGRTSYHFAGDFTLPAPFGAVDVGAEVRYPALDYADDATPETGEFPLVVFLHGNHCVCATSCGNHTCPMGDRIPNHRGYDYILDVLASRGYIAVSIDGFGVTAMGGGPTMTDYEARGQLVLEHLRRWRDYDQNGGALLGGQFKGRVDMDRIGLVGHSRGGEGVVAADVLNVTQSEGFDIEAVLAIAPTDQDWIVNWNPVSPYLVILPNNDGDVWNLQGQRTYDRAFTAAMPASEREEKTMFWLFGANHNFFNTTWTPGSGDPFASDDGSGIGRMTAPAQRRAGCQITAAFMEKQLGSDPRAAQAVRDELPMTGLGGLEVHVAHQRTPARIVDDFDHGGGKFVNSLGGAVATSGALPLFDLVSHRASGFNSSFRGDTDGLVLGANGDATYETTLPPAHRDVRRFRSLSVRVARIRESTTLPPEEQPAEFSLTLIDNANNVANSRFEVTQVATTPYPAPGSGSPTILSTVRVPLADFRRDNEKFDFRHVKKIQIRLRGDVKLAIDDIMFDDRGPPGPPFAWIEVVGIKP